MKEKEFNRSIRQLFSNFNIKKKFTYGNEKKNPILGFHPQKVKYTVLWLKFQSHKYKLGTTSMLFYSGNSVVGRQGDLS